MTDFNGLTGDGGLLNGVELAARLGVSRQRIAQLVQEGRLNGCFQGEGRSRRFDLDKAVQALKGNLDPGQMLGNGRETKRRLADLSQGDAPVAPRVPQKADAPLSPVDLDRYELARAANAEEDLRSKRLKNAKEEGLYVYAAEVERQMAAFVAREVAQFETVIAEGARAVADRMGVNFREVRQILTTVLRDHRTQRAMQLAEEAKAAAMTEAEKEQDA